jgi:hypothetical protein
MKIKIDINTLDIDFRSFKQNKQTTIRSTLSSFCDICRFSYWDAHVTVLIEEPQLFLLKIKHPNIIWKKL